MEGQTWRHYFDIWWKGIKKFPEITSIHGFRFIADPDRHWIERIFWLVFVIFSWYCSSLLIAAQYNAFQNNPISFVVETTYKDWDTEFPSVAVCENENIQRIEEMSDQLWGVDHDFNLEEVLKELAYFKGTTYYTSEFCGLENASEDCIKSNLSYYANMIRSNCEQTLTNCSWNDESFDCCQYFRPMDTELGICYAINTLQGRESNAPKYPMVSNKTTGPGAIKFDMLVPGNVYVLNEEEVPSITTIGSDVLNVGPEVYLKRYITIRNIENDAGARMIAPKKRKCRYIDENSLDVYRYYSYTACTVQCRKEAQLKFCNCTNFFMPNVPEHMKCDTRGIMCLNANLNELSVLKAKWASRPGLYCDCSPSCTEAEISIVKDFKVSTLNNFATVQIELLVLPSERYRRNVVRGVLDLVVSTGGTGGLFLGASIISFVELFYIVLIRPFIDIYNERNDDPWHRKYGSRKFGENNFAPNVLVKQHLNIHKFKHVLKAKWASRPGLYCDCSPSCTEAEISIVKDFKVPTLNNFATVQIELLVLPSERYRRNVVRGVLDLVVSTGGTGGLFLGASIISFVELFYIVLIRPFIDIYNERNDDPWHRKYGSRKFCENNFAPNVLVKQHLNIQKFKHVRK